MTRKMTIAALYPSQADRLRLPVRKGSGPCDSEAFWAEIADRLSGLAQSPEERNCLARLPRIYRWQWYRKERCEQALRCYAHLDYIAFVDRNHRFRSQVRPQLLEIGELHDLDWHDRMAMEIARSMRASRLADGLSDFRPTLTNMRNYQPSQKRPGTKFRTAWWGVEWTEFSEATSYGDALPSPVFDYIIWLQNLKASEDEGSLFIPAEYMLVAKSTRKTNLRGRTLGKVLRGHPDHDASLFLMRPGSQWAIKSVAWTTKPARFSLGGGFSVEGPNAGESGLAAHQVVHSEEASGVAEASLPATRMPKSICTALEDGVTNLRADGQRLECMRVAAEAGCLRALEIAATENGRSYERTYAIDLAAEHGYLQVLSYVAEHGYSHEDRVHAATHFSGQARTGISGLGTMLRKGLIGR